MEIILVNISKAAKILGVTTKTLRNWEGQGKLKPVRTLGKHRRYNLEEIKDLFQEK
jgi:excisionase family DNA binding protein